MDVLRPLAEWHAALSRYPLGRNHFFPSQAYLAQRVPSEVCQNPAEGFLHAAEDISKRSGVRQLRWVGQSGYGENRLESKGNRFRSGPNELRTKADGPHRRISPEMQRPTQKRHSDFHSLHQ